MKAEINVIKYNGGWGVKFNIGNQYFTLDYCTETKKEAEWMKKMLTLAFKNLVTPPVKQKEI